MEGGVGLRPRRKAACRDDAGWKSGAKLRTLPLRPRGKPPMRLTAPLIALLLLAACVDPQLQAGISIGPNGTSVYPAISTGIEGGGTITYSP